MKYVASVVTIMCAIGVGINLILHEYLAMFFAAMMWAFASFIEDL